VSFKSFSFDYDKFADYIVEGNYPEVDMMLIDLVYSGEKININRSLNTNGDTALTLASYFKAPKIIDLLLDSGDVFTEPLDLNLLNKNGDSAVTLSSFIGCLQCLETLLYFGAKATNIGPRNIDALFTAASSNRLGENERTELVLHLMKSKKVNINYVDSQNNSTLIYLLSRALNSGNKDFRAIYALIKAGVRINIKNKSYGDTPLHFAAVIGDLELVKTLINYGAYYTIKNNSGYTAIDNAQNNENTEVYEYLNSL
ncbi:ankyrin repeat domain-containing protein, partial [Halobacteriovorax sp. ZH3_bin.1]